MLPTLEAGDIVFVKHEDQLRTGDIIVLKHPTVGLVIKRIKTIFEECLYLIGDNKRLDSSTCHAPLSMSLAEGRVFAVYRFPFSIRLLPAIAD